MHEGETTIAADRPVTAPLTGPSVGAGTGGSDFAGEFLRANLLYTFGRFEKVDRVLEEAVRGTIRPGDLAMATSVRSSVRFWRLGDEAGSHRVLDEAAARVGDGPESEDLEAQRAVLWLFGGRTARALVVCRGVRRRGRGSARAVMLSAALEMMARGFRGEVAELGPPPVPPPTDELEELQCGFFALALTFAYVLNGVVVEAGGVVPGLEPGHRAEMVESSEGLALLVEALSLLWEGRPRSALERIEPAVGHLRHSDRAHVLPIALGAAAYGHALLGDADRAAAAADDAEAVRHPVARYGDYYVDRGRAWAEAARGELTAAQDRLAAAAGECERRGQPALAAQAWYDVARLGDAARAAPALARLARSAEPDGLVPLLAAHAGAVADADASAVADAAQRLLRRDHRLHAAEAAAQAAALHGRRRHRADADRWREVVRSLLAECEGARTPALAPLHDLDLTPREREIVGLAAQGLTNPDIARRLHLSVRTVGNHLQASYAKLGVHRREELAHLHPFGVEV